MSGVLFCGVSDLVKRKCLLFTDSHVCAQGEREREIFLAIGKI